jgi:hypothetical protein
VLKRIFGTQWHEVTGGWRKEHYERLHNLYSSPNTIKMNKSRKIGTGEHDYESLGSIKENKFVNEISSHGR